MNRDYNPWRPLKINNPPAPTDASRDPLQATLGKLVTDLNVKNRAATLSSEDLKPIYEALGTLMSGLKSPIHGQWLKAQRESFSRQDPKTWATSCEETVRLIQGQHLYH